MVYVLGNVTARALVKVSCIVVPAIVNPVLMSFLALPG